jgi:hypothetical protein
MRYLQIRRFQKIVPQTTIVARRGGLAQGFDLHLDRTFDEPGAWGRESLGERPLNIIEGLAERSAEGWRWPQQTGLF